MREPQGSTKKIDAVHTQNSQDDPVFGRCIAAAPKEPKSKSTCAMKVNAA